MMITTIPIITFMFIYIFNYTVCVNYEVPSTTYETFLVIVYKYIVVERLSQVSNADACYCTTAATPSVFR